MVLLVHYVLSMQNSHKPVTEGINREAREIKGIFAKEYISNIIQLSERKSEYYQVFVKLNLSVKSNSNISFCATTSSL